MDKLQSMLRTAMDHVQEAYVEDGNLDIEEMADTCEESIASLEHAIGLLRQVQNKAQAVNDLLAS